MSGEDLDLLPLDEEKLLEEAKPIAPDGRFRQDRAKLSARHDGQVQGLLAPRWAVRVPARGHQGVRREELGSCPYFFWTTLMASGPVSVISGWSW
jgi:hypothetical protein